MTAWETLDLYSPNIHEENDVNEVWLTLPLTKIDHGDPYNNCEKEPENDHVNDPANTSNGPVNAPNDHVNASNDHVNAPNDHVNDSNDYVNDHVNNHVNSLTETQRKIFDQIQANPNITYAKLCETLNISISTLTRTIRTLKNRGLITREGSDKTGKWKINH